MNYCDAMSCSDNSIVVVMAVVLMARVVLHSRQKIDHLAIPTITNTDEILENILGIMTFRMHLPTSIDYATVMICNYMYIYKGNIIVIVLCCYVVCYTFGRLHYWSPCVQVFVMLCSIDPLVGDNIFG